MHDSMISPETIQKWYKDKPATTFGDLAGMEDLKTQLRWEIDGILNPIIPSSNRSYFFYGLPGTGKTLTIRAFVRELMDAGYRCLSLNAADICSAYVGEAERMVHAAFQEALDNAPCVIVFDDIENVCHNRCRANLPRHVHSLTIAFLQGLDRIQCADRQVILVSSSNHPQDVDEAFLDHSRCVRFPLPAEEDRADFFARKLSHLHPEAGFTFEDMAKATPNYSYRELGRLLEGAVSLLKEAVIRNSTVLEADGSVNPKACTEALTSGSFPLTRTMFEEALRENPSHDKTRLLREQADFESRYSF